jgi:heme-degrading monooxygenase HmoA
MIEVVWEYVVKEEAQGYFELAFGPGGAWSKLFGRSAGFRGSTLLREVNDTRRYLLIDVWDTQAQREQALQEQHEVYANVEAGFGEWTESRREVGVFQLQAEGTVRPAGKPRGRRPGRRRGKRS